MDTIVYTVEGKEKGRYELPEYFNTEVKTALLHEITTGYLARYEKLVTSGNRGAVLEYK